MQINVNVTYAGPAYGRVVVAAEPVTRGDLLAAIPLDLCWNTVTAGGNGSMQVCTDTTSCAPMSPPAGLLKLNLSKGLQGFMSAPLE